SALPAKPDYKKAEMLLMDILSCVDWDT
ncbi:hypothetical protein LCGC14_1642690, partial [marine sediment metagenome]